MPLLEFNALTVSVASSVLIDSADALLIEGDRVGLVGENGSGKSTLLKLISSLSADQDQYVVASSGSISGDASPQTRTEGSVLLVQQDILSWEHLLPGAGTEEELRALPVEDALQLALEQGSECALEDSDSWRRLHTSAQADLCWNIADYTNTPIGQLSPGCTLRAYLAIALHRPDVRLLLLDEPTNHLDLPSILWLQRSILASGKSVIVVSHDEVFLDAIAEHVWEIDKDKHNLVVFGANYSTYMREKRLALEQQRAAYDTQQRRNKKLTIAAEKLRAATKAGERHLARDPDKLQRDFRRDRAGRSGKKAAAVEKLRDAAPLVERVKDRHPLRIVLEPIPAGSRSTIVLDDVVLGYSKIRLSLPPISLRIDYHERVSIVGYNGIGKTTLLRTLTGALEPLSGSVQAGRDLRIGNLTQEHEDLPRDTTPREHLAALSNIDKFDGGVRLIQYGLTLTQVDQPIGELNPGARARLLLAIFALRDVNVLILDEPTNHLDIEAITEVIATLETYTGTVVAVSHDRRFLESVRFSRTLLLSPQGLTEIDSVDAFVASTEDAVDRVVDISFRP
eukprot:m.836856 g.836856  ORF g.836856 m.836856 type:complete len:567 (+) comp23459_c0_seq13:153-1853(+)